MGLHDGMLANLRRRGSQHKEQEEGKEEEEVAARGAACACLCLPRQAWPLLWGARLKLGLQSNFLYGTAGLGGRRTRLMFLM